MKHDNQERTASIGQTEQSGWARQDRTAGQDSQDSTARTGWGTG
jgi:hypothetical protein